MSFDVAAESLDLFVGFAVILALLAASCFQMDECDCDLAELPG